MFLHFLTFSILQVLRLLSNRCNINVLERYDRSKGQMVAEKASLLRKHFSTRIKMMTWYHITFYSTINKTMSYLVVKQFIYLDSKRIQSLDQSMLKNSYVCQRLGKADFITNTVFSMGYTTITLDQYTVVYSIVQGYRVELRSKQYKTDVCT